MHDNQIRRISICLLKVKVKLKEKSKYFEIVDLDEINGGVSANSNGSSVVSSSGSNSARDCGWFDAVWCKAGDSCGLNDNLCLPGGPFGSGHDGCCAPTGRDSMGDSRKEGCIFTDML